MDFAIRTLFLSANGMNLTERLLYGGRVFIIGIATVFAVLAILWGAISIFKILMYDIPQKKARKKPEEELSAHISDGQSKNTDAPVSAAPAAVQTPAGDSGEVLAAVIAAAIAAYTAESGEAVPEGSTLPFRVVSYRRVKGANGWSGANDSQSF